MLRQLLHRPVAVSITVLALLTLGVIAMCRMPVSLMPEIDIPKVTVHISMDGSSAREVDRYAIQPLKQNLLQIPGLQDINCRAFADGGTITLTFDYRRNIDMAFIEVNERIDRTYPLLPSGIDRPKVIKASPSDIPIYYIDVTSSDQTDEGFISLSRFVQEIISKRIEQIPQVAYVDMSGFLDPCIVIEPNTNKLASLGIGLPFLEHQISRNNVSLGSIAIQDGQYQWPVQIDSEIRSVEDIEKISFDVNGRIFHLHELAKISTMPQLASGCVIADGRRAITLAVIKRSDARMGLLKKNLSSLMNSFHEEYGAIEFTISRDQTELLSYSVKNLWISILLGGLLAVSVLFFFYRNFQCPVIVAVTIPLSLSITLLVLSALDFSIDIMTLSGLLLGIGMLVDNSIIVTESISQSLKKGLVLEESVIQGTSEVIAPLISSFLTTCSVFLPLLFLSGIAGALFYSQATAVIVSLLSSLLLSITVTPVLYYILFKRCDYQAILSLRAPGLKTYVLMMKWVFRHPIAVWSLSCVCILAAIGLGISLHKSVLPEIHYSDFLVSIDWNEPLSLDYSKKRFEKLLESIPDELVHYEALIGHQDFILHQEEVDNTSILLYVQADSEQASDRIKDAISHTLAAVWPNALYQYSPAGNIFNALFRDSGDRLTMKVRTVDGTVPNAELFESVLAAQEFSDAQKVEPVAWQAQISVTLDNDRMALYGVTYESVFSSLSTVARQNMLFPIKQGTISVPVFLVEEPSINLDKLYVTSDDNTRIPLSEVASLHHTKDLKYIDSDSRGYYCPVSVDLHKEEVASFKNRISNIDGIKNTFQFELMGGSELWRPVLNEMLVVLLISFLLLFFILAIQFESLVQPIIILYEIGVNLFGALLALYLGGSGINLMSLIGIVTMGGIVVNDSILKVVTINRSRADGYSLMYAIISAGRLRYSSIVMTSLTTILALLPFLVRGSLGADLQYPLSLSLLGGLFFGTLMSLFFLPLLYYQIYSGRKR